MTVYVSITTSDSTCQRRRALDGALRFAIESIDERVALARFVARALSKDGTRGDAALFIARVSSERERDGRRFGRRLIIKRPNFGTGANHAATKKDEKEDVVVDDDRPRAMAVVESVPGENAGFGVAPHRARWRGADAAKTDLAMSSAFIRGPRAATTLLSSARDGARARRIKFAAGGAPKRTMRTEHGAHETRRGPYERAVVREGVASALVDRRGTRYLSPFRTTPPSAVRGRRRGCGERERAGDHETVETTRSGERATWPAAERCLVRKCRE